MTINQDFSSFADLARIVEHGMDVEDHQKGMYFLISEIKKLKRQLEDLSSFKEVDRLGKKLAEKGERVIGDNLSDEEILPERPQFWENSGKPSRIIYKTNLRKEYDENKDTILRDYTNWLEDKLYDNDVPVKE